MDSNPANNSSSAAVTVLEELLPDGTRGTPNQQYIAELYRDLLRREVDPVGLAVFSGLLDLGYSRFGVVSLIENEPHNEFFRVEVNDLYEQYLHRAADRQAACPG